jgi:amino acid adenylation domain-containing protein
MSDPRNAQEFTGLDKRARLARLLAERAAGAMAAGEPAAVPRSSIRRQPRNGPLPLSFAQQRIWFFEQLTPGTPIYHIHFGVRLTGRLDVERLRNALSTIVARHESLRTSFKSVDGSPVQEIHDARPVALPCTDLRGVPPAERESAVLRHAETAVRAPFDLTTGPLVRATLLHVDAGVHVLFVTVHHIVSDGASAANFMREIAALYDRPSAPLPELAVQYADFAAWQREQAEAGGTIDRQLAYWRHQLGGDLPTLALPADFPRPAAQQFRGSTYEMTVSPASTAALKAFSRERGATLFMTMLAAFQLLLARLAGQDDVIVGIPVSGRSVLEAEPLIGCFINTLPIRTRFDAAMTFETLLQHVRQQALDAYANQDVPFDRLVEELNPSRDRRRSPIFQVLFNMLGTDAAWRMQLQDVTASPLPQLDEPSKFDLTLYVGEVEGALYLRAVYDADLFAAPRVAACMAQYESLLAQVVADAGRSIGAYSLVTSEARERLPNPGAALPARWEGSILERLAALARADPDRLAIRCGSDEWTYRDLASRSADLAERLRADGASAGEIVAICAGRLPWLVAAMLGTWKAGAAFMLLDERYPVARLSACVRAARPCVLLSVGGNGAATAAALSETTGMAALAVEDVPPATSVDPEGAESPLDPDGLAYVAFTSGSTGSPKGILGTHRPLAHFVAWHVERFGLASSDRFSMLSGLSHDPLLRDVLTPLWIGGSIHMPHERALDSGHALVGWLRQEAVTVMHLTPPMAELIGQAGRTEAEALASLRYAFFGGDRLTGMHTAHVRARAPQARCVNFYGATETPQAMGCHEVDGGEHPPAASYPVGEGIDGVQLLVVNAANQLAGVGELGEICVRTPYLSRGYLGDDEQQAFATNPITGETGDRVYRTRDLGRYRPDGLVDACGRRDGQVKVRGFRVELGEVERELLEHPDVAQALVTTYPGEDDRISLVGYVVTRSEAVDLPAIRSALGARLPEYMVPAAILRLDAFPLSPNGKVDRQRLPLPGVDSLPARVHVPAATPIEEALVEIWSELLRAGRIGTTDNFFELGGHSLLGTQMVSRLRDMFDIDVPLRLIFDAPTIGALALAVTGLLLDDEAGRTAGVSGDAIHEWM